MNRPFRRGFAWHFRWLFPLALAVLACNAPGYRPSSYDDPELIAQEIANDTGMTLTEALAIPAKDNRGRVLELLGAPDTFRLTFQEVETLLSRHL